MFLLWHHMYSITQIRIPRSVHVPQADVREAEEDFGAACRHSLAHGNLLSLRYLIPDIPWQARYAHMFWS